MTTVEAVLGAIGSFLTIVGFVFMGIRAVVKPVKALIMEVKGNTSAIKMLHGVMNQHATSVNSVVENHEVRISALEGKK